MGKTWGMTEVTSSGDKDALWNSWASVAGELGFLLDKESNLATQAQPGEGMVTETWEGEEEEDMRTGPPGFVDSKSSEYR